MEGDPATTWGAILEQGKGHQGYEGDALVLNNDPAQVQPIKRGDFIPPDHRGSLSPFSPLTIGGHYLPFISTGCPCQVQISFFPKMIMLLT